ncbi:Bcr/CflA family multidrug efflux MFS transporter [Olivibacter sp. SDN3]|uniref:Bcr/CflA family multidrug efflux MFS transporter n=1 Tax=Olivibacter sp. SDN3 TaxID=2764720 RepID=UPI0016513B5E|nr:Bcr/CflA family multidrug efflux MFS transporter [Olivibacter sp. SDN3]QNL50110.1 Bcr/CflA family multidrug efflux MFS transporter [Olivibacter sp. SDN3]
MRTTKSRLFTILILGLLSAIGPLSIDMYLPGFQSIADDLETTVPRIQLSLTSFFIGVASGQLIYGPLLDRYGRKRPLIAGLIIYIIVSIACALTYSADHLIIFRFVQALGSCAGMVAARAMVRDYFTSSETAKVFSLLMLVIGVSPILAPTIGGFIIEHWDWHGIFILLALITTLILLAVIFILPESRGPNKQLSLKPKPIVKGFWEVFRTRPFYVNAFAGGIASSGLYAYLAGSPYVLMELHGVSEQQYGWIFAVIATALVTTSQLNNFLLRKHASSNIAKIALLLQALTGITLFSLTAVHAINLPLTIILIFIFLGCQGFTFPNTSAAALNPFDKSAGSASALLGSIQLGMGAISSALVSLFHNDSGLPMTGVMALCAVVSASILWFLPVKQSS